MGPCKLRRCCAWLLLPLLLLVMPAPALAADAGIQSTTAPALRADVPRLQALVAACASAGAACDDAKVGPDQRVRDGAATYEVHWQWLRDALKQAHDHPASTDADTAGLLRAAEARLQTLASDPATATAADTVVERRAQTTAEAVLRQPEFVREGPTWWERLKARALNWLFRLFEGVGRVGALAPWLGKAIEWGLFLGAVVGLVVFLLRSLSRQRLRVAMNAGIVPLTAWDRDASDWRALGERAALAGDWREAVHCLYWAAIVLLEGRRAWRHNPTRTPREYVRLLKPGSADREALSELTRTFERVWYGLGHADRTLYARAQQDFARLSDSSPTTGPAAEGGAA